MSAACIAQAWTPPINIMVNGPFDAQLHTYCVLSISPHRSTTHFLSTERLLSRYAIAFISSFCQCSPSSSSSPLSSRPFVEILDDLDSDLDVPLGRGGTLLNTQFASAQHGILVGSKTPPDSHVDRSAQSLREPWDPGFQRVTAHSVPGLRSCMEMGCSFQPLMNPREGIYRLRLFGNWTTSSEGDDDDGYDDHHDYVDDVKVRYIASSNGAPHDLRKPRVGPLSLRICISIGKDHLTSNRDSSPGAGSIHSLFSSSPYHEVLPHSHSATMPVYAIFKWSGVPDEVQAS
ncbi:uncharacterized protein LACBIDRAFT_328170 [Laccaria bicolor S238N-H82]|uniref:Predicted protein n=1 Tax=Laccaria bicolor (strain S238N-H82 / ATCC MYA-4686) TaxID=486041 RepID=B0DDY8_LACBS|nr:uncharacterized protein LACBIDRAFT_328170 [Laccaria bicolor S238N-H82]EDR07169.1 predicted protein [Laccaria bicolor S238N-H82]|eukprot:XP_001882100.1 predicted protein [Laccaria bicolor S238N-H82]